MLGNTSYKRKNWEKSYDIKDLWHWLVLMIALDGLHKSIAYMLCQNRKKKERWTSWKKESLHR